jgi:carbon-monoxide dehydrogenase catalytic subunit
MGECLDNARASALFRTLADAAGANIGEMPYAFASPEWSNEKGLAASTAFRLLGIDSYHSVYAPLAGSRALTRYFSEETKETLGSSMVVDLDPVKLADRIVKDMKEKTRRLRLKTRSESQRSL